MWLFSTIKITIRRIHWFKLIQQEFTIEKQRQCLIWYPSFDRGIHFHKWIVLFSVNLWTCWSSNQLQTAPYPKIEIWGFSPMTHFQFQQFADYWIFFNRSIEQFQFVEDCNHTCHLIGIFPQILDRYIVLFILVNFKCLAKNYPF